MANVQMPQTVGVVWACQPHFTLRRKNFCHRISRFHDFAQVNLLPLAKGADELSEIPRFPRRFPLN